jgi:stress response protein YsnF
MIPLTKETV